MFFTAAKTQRPDQRQVAPPVGWSNTASQIVMSRCDPQGIECRRPSEMHVRATREVGRVTNVRVGGYAVEILRGTVVL